MPYLVDSQLRTKIQNGLLMPGINPELINSSSVDVTLFSEVLRESRPVPGELPGAQWERQPIGPEGLRILPGEFFLASTEQRLDVPEGYEALFSLKSTLARIGLDHAFCGFVEGGFIGQLTLELRNVNRFHGIDLTSGMRIGSIRFYRLDEIPSESYRQRGRYNLQQGPTESR